MLLLVLVAALAQDEPAAEKAPFKDRIVTIRRSANENRSEIWILEKGKLKAAFPAKGNAALPSVRPDGRAVAYTASFRDSQTRQRSHAIYLMDVDGSSRELAQDLDVHFWIADGKRLLASKWREDKPHYFLVSADDGAVTELPAFLNDYGICGQSPDGQVYLCSSLKESHGLRTGRFCLPAKFIASVGAAPPWNG